MLKQRVVTALVLVGILLPALWVDHPLPFALLSLLFVGAAGWEWGRLTSPNALWAWALGAAVVLGCVGLAYAWHLPLWTVGDAAASHASVDHVHGATHALVGFSVPALLWWAVAVVWALGLAMTLRWGIGRWRTWPMLLRWVLGWGAVLTAWLALSEARAGGLNLLLSLLCLVWAADIGAYFGGRALGRRKLAPSISPGKSWEGVFAGLLATQLLAWVWLVVDQSVGVDSPSLYTYLRHGLGTWGMAGAVLLLTAASVAGDLFESLIKREAGVKDSSQLLPGHGGVLDRIDALLPVLPLSMALLTLTHA